MPGSYQECGRADVMDYLATARNGRLIVWARMMLALFLLLSVVFGELRQDAAEHFAWFLLAAYMLVLAATMLPGLRRRAVRTFDLILAIDAIALALLLYATAGSSSSSFGPLIFVVLCATVQWGSRGAIVSGVLVVAILLLPVGWQMLRPDRTGAFSMTLARLGSIAMITIMLAGIAWHFEHLLKQLGRLSHPIVPDESSGELPLLACLKHALFVFQGRSGLLLWSDPEEPHLLLAQVDQEGERTGTLPALEEPLVADWVNGAPFLYNRKHGTTIFRMPAGLSQEAEQVPFLAFLNAVTNYRQVLAVPLSVHDATGLVLVLDPPMTAADDLTTATMLGRQISLTLETSQLHAERRLAAASRERVRLARDLHDGVLQFLAGSRLQLDLIGGTDLSEDARNRVQQMREAISEEQRQLRNVIGAMNKSPEPGLIQIRPALIQVADHLAKSWGIQILADVSPYELDVPQECAEDLIRITREAVANAVRHGGASIVRLEVWQEGKQLKVSIQDDGRGFPFEGEMTHERLSEFPGRPRSIYARVSAMGGRLMLSSATGGARLDISAPLQASA
jgi:signal transduction histidine kinase